MFQTVVLHEAFGSPAAPWHSRTVVREEPPVPVIVLTTVTWQIRPRPPVLSTPLLQVEVEATFVAALAPPATAREPRIRSPAVSRRARNRVMRVTSFTV